MKISILRNIVVMAGFLLISSPLPSMAINCSAPVATESGLVSGKVANNNDACAYLGIPYSAPPVGDLRWAPPQPHPKWNGVRKAEKFGHWCLQKRNIAFDPTVKTSDMSEDCLYLNVWRPKKEGKFPVMVWIHGGGYTTGSSALPLYHGDNLSANGDLVVVSFNYRLNVFGFLAHENLAKENSLHTTGNYGSLDQVFALKWVKQNIASFGGDPENITIFGESAGGWSVCAMVATPLARGLFNRAIIQSGGCESFTTIEEGNKFADEVAKKVGCQAGDFSCMRQVKAKKLLEAGWEDLFSGRLVYINHKDDYFLEQSPLETIKANKHNKVPIIVGSNHDEGRPVVMFLNRYKKAETLDGLIDILKQDVGENYEKLLELYPIKNYSSPREAYAQMFTDRVLGCPGYRAARELARQKMPTYYYRFDYNDIRWRKSAGAFHGLEIGFVLGNLTRMPIKLMFSTRQRKRAQELSAQMMNYWIEFARKGDPNSRGNVEWLPFDPDGERKRLIFNLPIVLSAEPAERDGQCEFWQGLPPFPKLEL